MRLKEPSPAVKPETQKGSGMPLKTNSGLGIGTTLGKASVNLSGRPQLR